MAERASMVLTSWLVSPTGTEKREVAVRSALTKLLDRPIALLLPSPFLPPPCKPDAVSASGESESEVGLPRKLLYRSGGDLAPWPWSLWSLTAASASVRALPRATPGPSQSPGASAASCACDGLPPHDLGLGLRSADGEGSG